MAIETAVRGGSVSLLRADEELDQWIGTDEHTKSKNILVEIEKILKRNSCRKKEITKVVVSRGPGSYTGARSGLAIGIGLSKSLDCQLFSVSVLKALLVADETAYIKNVQEIMTVIPYGRDQICHQHFKLQSGEVIYEQIRPQISAVDEFLSFTRNVLPSRKLIMHRKLYRDLREKYETVLPENNGLLDAGENMAVFCGKIGGKSDGETSVLSPIYIG